MKEETLLSALLLAFAIAFIIIFLIATILFVVKCIEKYIDTKEERRYRYKAGMKTNESRPQAVHVLINNRPVWLDLENLRDDELAMRNKTTGEYETESGEQHFTHKNAVKTAGKQGKRLPTDEEYEFIASRPHRWDDDKKGMWFIFNRVEGGYVEVFFPAAGYRNRTTGALSNPGAYGYYWSATVAGTNAYYLHFSGGNINPSNTGSRANGSSVRCVRSENK
jgi:hypothetical protein